MSRTQIVLKCNDKNNAIEAINKILDSNRYDHIEKNNEDYWKQGIGVTESPKFIRYYFEEDNIILEGWVSNFGKESNLDGFVGALPKKSCKKVLNQVKEAVENLNNQPVCNPSGQIHSNQQLNNTDIKNSAKESSSDNIQKSGRAMLKNESNSTEDTIKSDINNSLTQSDNTTAHSNNFSTNTSTQNKTKSNGLIPRRYRGSILTNIFEIILALFYIYGASTGYLVLRFTDSSEALILVAIIILIHGVLSLISNLSDK